VQTPLDVALVDTKKRASKCALEKPLVVGPGPVALAGRRAGAGGPMGIASELTPRMWCPLHEMSLHDVTSCRPLGIWWRSVGNALQSMLPRERPTAATSAARLATGRAATLARSLLWKDWAAQEGAWWEPGQGAMRVTVCRGNFVGDIPNGYTSDVVLNQQARVAHQGWYGGFAIPGGPVAEVDMAVLDAGAYGGFLDMSMADRETGPWRTTDDKPMAGPETAHGGLPYSARIGLSLGLQVVSAPVPTCIPRQAPL
jgi:hypothetical protein